MFRTRFFLLKGILIASLAFFNANAFAQQAPEVPLMTLQKVMERGILNCGVTEGLLGFSERDGKDMWQGFDVDFCRAVSVAIFGDESRVAYVPLSGAARFDALNAGQVDLLSRVTTETLWRDTQLGVNFGPVMFHDGQGFMVRGDSTISSIDELDGASICVLTGTTTIENLRDYFSEQRMAYTEVAVEHRDEMYSSFDSGGCDALTDDTSALAADREGRDADYVILPGAISKEPLAPVVRHGDDQWLDLIKYVAHALVTAEELGISSLNVNRPITQKRNSAGVKWLLGLMEEDTGAWLGLTREGARYWARDIVVQVGNYAEIYDYNVGEESSLGIKRGINELYKNGGILMAPPLR